LKAPRRAGTAMHPRDFRIGWRLLIKQPGYSAVAILGLAIGFAACLLLLGYVRYSLSYDSMVPQAQHIYLVKGKLNIGPASWNEATPLPFLDVAARSGMVEASTVLQPLFTSMKVDARVTKDVKLYAVHPAFAAMFGLKLLAGDIDAALTRPDALALTEGHARILFGHTGAVGKTVHIAGRAYTVAAVLPDPASNSTIDYAALTGVAGGAWREAERNKLFQAWGRSTGGRLYVKLKPGATPAALEHLLQEAADGSPMQSSLPPAMLRELGGRKLFELRLGALPDLYFDRDTADSPGSVQHGDPQVVYGLAAVAVLILLLAVSNYVNLATVQMVRRQREIALRKLMGATVGRLGHQFLAESVLLSLVAAVIGLLLAALMLPAFAELMDRKLDNLFTPVNMAGTLVLGILVGLGAGAYPAWVAWRVRPQRTLAGRGSSETVGGLRLRRLLTVVQFSAAMALIAGTLAITWQTWFASHADPGFDPQPLLVLELPGVPNSAAQRGMRAALGSVPGVTGVSAAQDVVGRPFFGNNDEVARHGEAAMTLPLPAVSANFFEVLGLRPLAGRLFDSKLDGEEKPAVTVLNASAVRTLGFASAQQAVGQVIAVGTGAQALSLRIVGVAPDIRYESLRQQPKPMVYLPSQETNILTVRTSGNLGELERAAETLQQQYFPDHVVSVRRMESYFAENYANDLRLARLLGLASLIALAIAAFGIYVLSAYNVQRLTMQIVLRKLFGANRRAIAQLVLREFLVLLGISAAVGLPVAAVANQRYLAGFVEHAPIGAWPLLAAGAVALLVTLAATLRHTAGAMRIAPAAALRDQ
jgi:putative ABC transport system permease protein